MAANTKSFLIQEIAEGAALKAEDGAGQEFVWTAANHNMPMKPWTFGGQQRTKRVDYPGADSPTEQILGANHTPFTLSGTWVDKFNPKGQLAAIQTLSENAERLSGYAKETMRAFEAMARRGNLIKFSYGDVAIEGIITSWEFSIEHEGKIGYSFTVSPHQRPGGDQITNRPLKQVVKDPFSSEAEIRAQVSEMVAKHNLIDTQRVLKGTTFEDNKSLIEDLQSGAQELSDLVNQRSTTGDSLDRGLNPTLALRKAVAVSSFIIGTSSDIITGLAGLKSNTAVAFQDALAVLRFETWTRGLSAQARITIFNTAQTRESFIKQTDPNAIALYRPFANESLYSISQKFYGTPYNWRLIKERNKLTSSNLTGQELLVIPEATA